MSFHHCKIDVGMAAGALPEWDNDPPMLFAKWIVLRHGGLSTHRWRKVAMHIERARIEHVFDDLKRRMRQGGVALIDPHGKIARYYSAPRLRTRW